MTTDAAYIDVTDETFQAEVMDRSSTAAVVVDLWAPWCGPCRQLGPILEQVVADTDGKVVLAKINIDENPAIHQAFKIQSIPAVYAIKDGKVVDGFIGAKGTTAVKTFVDALLPSEADNELVELIAAGDEDSLRRALELDVDNEVAIIALAELLIADDRSPEALDVLARIPESADTRRVAALARTGRDLDDAAIDSELTTLLDQVKDDDAARQRYIDLLELLGPDDPRTTEYRRQLTARLY